VDIIYRAFDGKQFNNEKDCLMYEEKERSEIELLKEIGYIQNNNKISIDSIMEVKEDDKLFIPNNPYYRIVFLKYMNKYLNFTKGIDAFGHYIFKEGAWINLEEKCHDTEELIKANKSLMTQYEGFIKLIDNQLSKN